MDDEIGYHEGEEINKGGGTLQFYNKDGTVKDDPKLKEEWKKRHDWYMEKGQGRFLSRSSRNCTCHPEPNYSDPEVSNYFHSLYSCRYK